jgi:hypothetical protein
LDDAAPLADVKVGSADAIGTYLDPHLVLAEPNSLSVSPLEASLPGAAKASAGNSPR